MIDALVGMFATPDITDTPYWTKRGETFLRCVAERESGNRWRAHSQYGSGIVQWTQRTWDHYAAHAGLHRWVGKRPHTAPRRVQWTVAHATLNPDGDPGLEGRHHWSPRHALTIGKVITGC